MGTVKHLSIVKPDTGAVFALVRLGVEVSSYQAEDSMSMLEGSWAQGHCSGSQLQPSYLFLHGLDQVISSGQTQGHRLPSYIDTCLCSSRKRTHIDGRA